MLHHYAPASFDKDATDVVVLSDRPEWSSGTRALRVLKSVVVLTLVPLFWQLLPGLHGACRVLKVPFFLGSMGNLTLAAVVAAEAAVDTVMAEACDAQQIIDALKLHGVAPRAWVLLHRGGEVRPLPMALLAPYIQVAQEVHAIPGVACLAQCEVLIARKEALFHTVPMPAAVEPLATEATGTCTCGETIYRCV